MILQMASGVQPAESGMNRGSLGAEPTHSASSERDCGPLLVQGRRVIPEPQPDPLTHSFAGQEALVPK